MSNDKITRPYFLTTNNIRIPLGLAARRQINHSIIYRVRRGNGYFGSGFHEIIQDQYPYFVPPSINNPEGQNSRNAFAAAVLNWQTVLTDEQKNSYNKKATKGLRMSGYNLYIREYVRANA